jgi:hypothetical protein
MSQLFGKYRATVVDDQDPTATGRLMVDVPTAALTAVWAEASLPPIPMSLVHLPPAGAEVWVEFEEGDAARPIWTGATWHTRPTGDVIIECEGSLIVQAMEDAVVQAGNGCSITAGSAATLTAGSEVAIDSGAELDLRSAGQTLMSSSQMVVTTPHALFSGLVQTETVVTDHITAASYSPGAGNVL